MNKYTGHFEFFSEMGMEGSASVFFDEKSKYLNGYDQLSLSYFFKPYDKIVNIVIDNNFIKELNFVYDGEHQIVKPLELSFDDWKKWIDDRKMVSFSIEKKLFKDKIILKSEKLEMKMLKSEIAKLLKSNNNELSEEFLKYKNQILELKKLLKELNKKSLDGTKVNINDYIFNKSDYYFNRSPLDIILTGDGETVLKNLRDRLGIE